MTNPSQRRFGLIVNPASGGGKAGRRAPEVATALTSAGHDVITHVTTSLEDGEAATAAALQDNRIAVAVGGDGIVSSVAGAVAKAGGVSMGLVPFGRGNDFARALGIGSFDVAIKALDKGVLRKVDLGYAGGRYFTCIASMGFDSKVVESADRTKLVRGALVYPYATVKALLRWKPADFTIELHGRVERVHGFSVAAANGSYFGGGMRLAPDASLDDGLFDVVAISKVSRLHFLLNGLKVFKGTHVKNPEVSVWQAAKVTFRSTEAFTVYADGEAVAPAPLTVEVKPGALEILTPI